MAIWSAVQQVIPHAKVIFFFLLYIKFLNV
jgi:hypothetical protein